MSLKYDPEFLSAAEPALSAMGSLPSLEAHDVEGRRTRVSGMMAAMRSKLATDTATKEEIHTVKSYDGHEIKIHQFYVEGNPRPGPAVFHIHGGGMILGDIPLFEAGLKLKVQATGVPIFSVDYRLAPEYPAPTPVEDCYAGLTWLSSHSHELGVDPARIAIMGESAGGGLAAGTTLLARDRQLSPPLAKQILIYPMLDDRNISTVQALDPFAFWTYTDNLTGWAALLGEQRGTELVSPYSAPARVKSVSGLPPTYIDVGGLDIFRDECLSYGSRIAKENIEVDFHVYPGVPHAFEVLGPNTAVVALANQNRTRAMTSF